jgi:hypothetical protein
VEGFIAGVAFLTAGGALVWKRQWLVRTVMSKLDVNHDLEGSRLNEWFVLLAALELLLVGALYLYNSAM